MKIAFLTLFLLCCLQVFSQKITISGYIQDIATGEKLIGAAVTIPGTTIGTSANTYGFYSLTIPFKDSMSLAFSMVGYPTIIRKITTNADQKINISLNAGEVLKEVEVKSGKDDQIKERTRMSTIDVPISQIKQIPALLGEVDVLKALQLLPGVKSGEGSSGLYVRGGGPDQNLILLDGVPVYNASHLFGFFSVFNADAIKNVELTKGGFPARYGGRLSSVVDINMKEGNTNKISGEASIGVVSAKFTLEGPIIKEKTSFIVSARRTYIDILARPLIKAQSDGNVFGYYFYDVNAKVNHTFSDKDRLFLSLYTGTDKFYANFTDFGEKNDFGLSWGNITSALRWNHVLNKKLFGNLTLTYSRYQFLTDISTSSNNQQDIFNLKYFSGINDLSAKLDFDYAPHPNHYIRFGSSVISHYFNPGATTLKISNNSLAKDTSLGSKGIYANEFSAYIEDDYRITPRLKMNIGAYGSDFFVNTTHFYSLQPRVSLRYLMDENWALKASYVTMSQNIHLLANSSVGLPTDLWLPATKRVKPETSWQPALGVSRTIRTKYEFSVEGYYKYMNNLIEYAEGASFMDQNANWQDKVEQGHGTAYGMEFFLQRKEGKTTGWIGYTLSWATRQFDNLNGGKEYPYKYDRRHDMSFVISHKFSERIDIGGTFVFGTGNAITLPIGKFSALDPSSFDNSSGSSGTPLSNVSLYGKRNDYRMASYHRADIGINFRKKHKWGERTVSIGAYNVYNRKNPYFIYFTQNQNNETVAKQVSLFPVIPSVSYSIKF